jgi:hypothetical protein
LEGDFKLLRRPLVMALDEFGRDVDELCGLMREESKVLRRRKRLDFCFSKSDQFAAHLSGLSPLLEVAAALVSFGLPAAE